jgi:hypothetical protein
LAAAVEAAKPIKHALLVIEATGISHIQLVLCGTGSNPASVNLQPIHIITVIFEQLMGLIAPELAP